jgi:hypothetical protein
MILNNQVSRWTPLTFRGFLVVGLLLLSTFGGAAAQSNFSFELGGTSMTAGEVVPYVGVSIGSILKFGISPILRLRTQLYVDKLQVSRNPESFDGNQSVTFTVFGIGVEAAYSTKDFSVFVNATPHGTVWTTMHSGVVDNSVDVVSVTRFSGGMVFGAGAETFITDNVGLEGQVQYDIFNFDGSKGTPRHIGVRAMLGLQFYLGLNYQR